jgi:hypothetical protein
LVHDWHVVKPAAVEYWPAPQAAQVLPVRRNPALQILFRKRVSKDSPRCKHISAHQGHVLLLGRRAPHVMYWALLAGLFVQALQDPLPAADL